VLPAPDCFPLTTRIHSTTTKNIPTIFIVVIPCSFKAHPCGGNFCELYGKFMRTSSTIEVSTRCISHPRCDCMIPQQRSAYRSTTTEYFFSFPALSPYHDVTIRSEQFQQCNHTFLHQRNFHFLTLIAALIFYQLGGLFTTKTSPSLFSTGNSGRCIICRGLLIVINRYCEEPCHCYGSRSLWSLSLSLSLSNSY